MHSQSAHTGEAMAMSKRCVVQGRQVHGGVSVGEGTRAANRKQGQFPYDGRRMVQIRQAIK